MRGALARLQTIDRRAIYLVLIVLLAVPYFVRLRPPVYVSPETRDLYETIEGLARERDGRIVLVPVGWGPGTQGENEPQMEAMVYHLVRRRVPFALINFSTDAVGARLADRLVDRMIARVRSQVPGFAFPYGKAWINLGIKSKGDAGAETFLPLYQALASDVSGFVRNDYRHEDRDVRSFPIMERLRTIDDMALVLEISAGDTVKEWFGIMKKLHPHLLVGVATTSIVYTHLYPYYRSGDLAGILDGLRGAVEYWSLADPTYSVTKANAMSIGRLLIIALVIAGNIGYFAAGRRIPSPEPAPRRRSRAGAAFWSLVGLGLAAVAFLEVRAGWPPTFERLGTWTGVLLSIGVYTFLWRDNRLFRFLEHFIIGSAAAYTLYEAAWVQVLDPKWFRPMIEGFKHGTSQWALVLLLLPASLWFFSLSRRYAWLSSIIVGLMMGVTVGATFQREIGANMGQIADSFRPIGGSFEGLSNLLFLLLMLLVLFYFLFFLRSRRPAVRRTLRAARIAMMITFGVLFGNTVATRLSWFLGRMDFLINDWLRPILP